MTGFKETSDNCPGLLLNVKEFFLQNLTNLFVLSVKKVNRSTTNEMSHNFGDHAQKLRQQAEELLRIAEQLENKAKTTKNTLSIVHEPKNESALLPEQQHVLPEKWAELLPEQPHVLPEKWAELLPEQQHVLPETRAEGLDTSNILLSRNKYQTCYIRLPESEERLPGLRVDRDYFSLVRVFRDLKQVLAAKAKLEWNLHLTVITQISTGYALWVWEPIAQPDLRREEDPKEELGNGTGKLHLVSVSGYQNQAHVSLTEYLSIFNQLSESANQHLGTAVVVHYWKSSRPELSWLDQFEVVGSGQIIICGNGNHLSLNGWQEKQLQFWLKTFIQRCRRVIHNFPQPFLYDYNNAQLLAHLLDEHVS